MRYAAMIGLAVILAACTQPPQPQGTSVAGVWKDSAATARACGSSEPVEITLNLNHEAGNITVTGNLTYKNLTSGASFTTPVENGEYLDGTKKLGGMTKLDAAGVAAYLHFDLVYANGQIGGYMSTNFQPINCGSGSKSDLVVSVALKKQ